MGGSRTRGWSRFLSGLGIDVRPGEAAAVWLLFSSFFLLVTCQYITKTVRQSTFIDSLGATNLPFVYLLVALCSYPLLQLYIHAADRVSRHRLIVGTCAAVMAGMVGFWWLYRHPWKWVPVAFYIFVSIVFITTISQLWSLASHTFDPRQAKRLFGLLGAGGLLGGIAGGQVARLATRIAGTHDALLVGAALLGGNMVLAFLIHRARPTEQTRVAGSTGLAEVSAARGGLAAIRSSPHLRLVALILVLGVVAGQVIDLQFNWAVENATSGLGDRTEYFGNFFSIVGIAAFLFQIIITPRIHRSLGVGVALRVLPVTLGVGTVALLLAGGMFPEALIVTALGLKVGESGIRYSLDQSTRELLFLPVPASLRVRAKAFIDIFVHRSAKGFAALLLLPVAFGIVTPVQAGWVALAVVVAWLVAVSAAYGTYVTSFRAGLKRRTVDAAVPINLSDVKTVELLVQSLGSSDPRQVLHSLEILEANGRGNLVPPLLLYHDDAAIRQRTLQILVVEGRKDAAPLVERRLGDESPEVRAEAIRALTEFHAGDACSLMLPRLKESDPRVRAAAVTCLINHGDEETRRTAGASLDDMLSEADPEHRAEAIKAIGAIHDCGLDGHLVRALDDPDTRVSREAIESVRRIVARNGFNPLFVPKLVSLLSNRRLKLDAREALVAFGQDAVPILVHFMNDREESIWVRRALPKALARIGGPSTIDSLTESLLSAEDTLLREQIVEALVSRRDEIQADGSRRRLEEAVHAEARHYLTRLSDIAALGEGGRAIRLHGARVEWDPRAMNLLSQMIVERLGDHLKTLFGLLALLHPPRDIWAAYRSFLIGGPSLRAHALEFLDNTLAGEVHRSVFAVIDDAPLIKKLHLARRLFGIEVGSRAESVCRILDGHKDGSADSQALTVGGLYTVYEEKLEALYPRVEGLLGSSDPLVQETAAWVAGRLKSA